MNYKLKKLSENLILDEMCGPSQGGRARILLIIFSVVFVLNIIYLFSKSVFLWIVLVYFLKKHKIIINY